MTDDCFLGLMLVSGETDLVDKLASDDIFIVSYSDITGAYEELDIGL